MLKTPSELPFPAYLLNFPFTVDNRVINNVLMEKYAGQPYDYSKAYAQFMNLYRYLCKQGIVYLLPSEGNYQDQVYTANVGCYLPHLKESAIILSNFKSEPRRGEEKIASKFFQMMKYHLLKPPYYFEGEADMKWIRDAIYIAGYGIRSAANAYDWIAVHTDAKIILIRMTDHRCYHFDCVFLPINSHKAMVATSLLSREDVHKIESVVEIVQVPEKYVYDAWTNCIVLHNKILFAPDVGNEVSTKDFSDFTCKLGLEPVIIDLSEFGKSGAALSCMVAHLNYAGRK
jgi:N-dimethylarginine dimethylaminohydrolase